MTILRSLIIASFLAASSSTLLLAQGGREGRGGGQGGQPPRNLQVLPKEMSRAELTPIMRGIATALGVRCNYCHVVTSPAEPEPAGGGRGSGEQFDYALDDKETKKTAREMLRMVMDINEKYLPAMGRTLTARTRVTCETCHHGLTKPQSLVNALAGAVEAKGADSAVALYRDLRTRYFGRAAYDFGELSLQDAATEVGRMPNQRPAAVALLKLNLEFYPQSVPSFAALAQHSVALGDTAGAVDALNRGLAVQPDNQQLRNMLNRIRPPR